MCVPFLVLVRRLILDLFDAGTGDAQAGDERDHGDIGQDLDLSVAEPGSCILDQIQVTCKEPNDTAQVVHPAGPSIADFLLVCGWNVHDQGPTAGLYRVDRKVQTVEPYHGEPNCPSFHL